MLLHRRESRGGTKLGDDLVLAAFIRHLLQSEMSLPDLSVLLNPKIAGSTSPQ